MDIDKLASSLMLIMNALLGLWLAFRKDRRQEVKETQEVNQKTEAATIEHLEQLVEQHRQYADEERKLRFEADERAQIRFADELKQRKDSEEFSKARVREKDKKIASLEAERDQRNREHQDQLDQLREEIRKLRDRNHGSDTHNPLS